MFDLCKACGQRSTDAPGSGICRVCGSEKTATATTPDVPLCKYYSRCKQPATMYVDRLWLPVDKGRRVQSCAEHAATIGSLYDPKTMPWKPDQFYRVTPMERA